MRYKMIVVIIILAILTTIGVIIQNDDEWGAGWVVFATITGFFMLAALFFSVKWQISSQNLTGYVYQSKEIYGYTNYSLRYSQYAGEDKQSEFCVKTGSEQDKKFQEVLGKNVKVQIYVPSRGFGLVNNPWECQSFATLEKGE